ncbi:hypothetical protein EJ05DRAFT_492665 [Pseudovirgaria hyperparasitica]|uniref:C4-dicarboxylate transporter/malic acid transport protein n=1 Tax=Pseudovirgaria hyperparasitica TaxID=470096 RepID=A0A6A6W950_9PEZI|nr:uncharacterized protein EJ05DRAFT_492665 [Pseudovirgaria hyperparasitica]KAF2759372.1 hypothetical protein EJ05DRAFT_492665 [Pseudovirgaria hyperparasitica]
MPNKSTPRSLDVEKQDHHDSDSSRNNSVDSSGPFAGLSAKDRIHHFTWAWYTLTMSTGGIATLLEGQPHSFPGLFEIGVFFYGLNLTIFAGVTITLIVRFIAHPGDLMNSIRHEREGLFVPTFFLTIATIISGTHRFIVIPSRAGGESPASTWLLMSIALAYWVYYVATFCLAIAQYAYLFAGHDYHLTKMMPSWLLPIFPSMLSGTIASIIAIDQPVSMRLPMLVSGLAAQGLGFWVAILMYAHLIGRLMQVGLPNREHRAALFIGVGPPSFTALALIGMSKAIPDDIYILGNPVDPSLFRTVATLCAISLWLLAFWFFCITVIAVAIQPPKFFHLGMWACVFPNTGFTIATISIGNALDNEAIRYVGNSMTVVIVLMWLIIVSFQIRAILKNHILWPGRDEDVED